MFPGSLTENALSPTNINVSAVTSEFVYQMRVIELRHSILCRPDRNTIRGEKENRFGTRNNILNVPDGARQL